MNKLILISLFLTFPLISKSQSNHKIDSLKKVLAKLPVEGRSYNSDTIRVRVLCGICVEIDDPDSTLMYAEKAIKISEFSKWIAGQYRSNFLYAKALHQNGYYIKALDQFMKILLLTEKNGMRKSEALISREIADNYLWLKRYEQANDYYRRAMNIFKTLHEYEEYADTQNMLAISFINLKQFDKAINLLKDCLNYLSYINGKISEPTFYDNLALAYGGLQQYTIALSYSQKAIFLYKNMKQTKDVLFITSRSLLTAGFNYVGDKKFDDALTVLKKISQINAQYGGNDIEMNQLYYEVYKGKKDFKKATYYLEKFKSAENQSTEIEKNRLLEFLISNYQLDKEKKKVYNLNENLEKEQLQKKVLIGGTLLILFFSIFAYWSFISQKKKNRQIEEQKSLIEDLNINLESKISERTEQLLKANNELVIKNKEIIEALFQGQSIERKRVASELHDNLGGTLSALKWRLEALEIDNLNFDEKKIYASILQTMQGAYAEVRLISHNMLPNELEKKGVIEAIRRLIIDFNQIGKIKFYFNENSEVLALSSKQSLEIYSITLELLNNILKHSKAKNAYLELTVLSNKIILKISDDGIGINQNTSKGMGLENIKNRVSSINGILHITSQKNEGTTFLIEIPQTVEE